MSLFTQYVRYVRLGGVLYTLMESRPHSIQSGFDIVKCEPAASYLADAHVLLKDVPSPLLMVGLGGGTLSAARALLGKTTHVIEVNLDMIRAYASIMRPVMRQHCGLSDMASYVHIAHADATDRNALARALPSQLRADRAFLDYVPCLNTGVCAPAIRALSPWLTHGSLVYINIFFNASLTVPVGWRQVDARTLGRQYVSILMKSD